jgi:shikimate kinase
MRYIAGSAKIPAPTAGGPDMPAARILLTGFMGCGKSTVGPLVADHLGYRFIDTDERVEAAAGRSAEALFLERGESVFRALETAVLSQAMAEDEVVIATGGGALISEGSLGIARDGGVVVYLQVRPETLAARLQTNAGRPLLHDEDGHPLEGGLLLERIRGLLARRERYYAQADATVEADDLTPPDAASAVVRAVLAHSAA